MISNLKKFVAVSMLALSTGVGACDAPEDDVASQDQYDLADEDALVADTPEAHRLAGEVFTAPVDDDISFELAPGMVKVVNLCESLSLYQYNPAYHGTDGNPRVEVGMGKKLTWQTLAGTPNGWATVLSAGQEYWGWRYARVECLGGEW